MFMPVKTVVLQGHLDDCLSNFHLWRKKLFPILKGRESLKFLFHNKIFFLQPLNFLYNVLAVSFPE